MATKQIPAGLDLNEAVIRYDNGYRSRSNTLLVYVPVLTALVLCVFILATSLVVLTNSNNVQSDSRAILNLQEQIDALRSQLQSSQDCNSMVRSRRQVPNEPSVSSLMQNRTGTGVAQLYVGSPSNTTMEGRWKLVGSVNQHQFMYFGSTILHWTPGNVFDPTHFELLCNGAIKVLQSGLYYIRAQISLTTSRNMEAINIVSKGKPLVTMQTNTLARVQPQKENEYGFFHVFNPATYAYLESGSEVQVQTMTRMEPRTSIVMTNAASHISLEKISA